MFNIKIKNKKKQLIAIYRDIKIIVFTLYYMMRI